MGQRSQLFIDVNYQRLEEGLIKDKQHYLVARYFQWNYGERMISRARGIIEWITDHARYIYFEEKELNRICDVNWDMHDIVISSDILKEFNTEGYDYWNDTKDMILGQDNNDGKLFITVDVMEINDKKKNKEYTALDIKYCFTDYDTKYLGNVQKYAKWNISSDLEKTFADDKSIFKYTKKNMEYIDKHAHLMSKKELEAFINKDFSDYEFAKKHEKKKKKSSKKEAK